MLDAIATPVPRPPDRCEIVCSGPCRLLLDRARAFDGTSCVGRSLLSSREQAARLGLFESTLAAPADVPYATSPAHVRLERVAAIRRWVVTLTSVLRRGTSSPRRG